MSLATRLTVERALAAYILPLNYGGQSVADFAGAFRGDAATNVPFTVHCICGVIAEDGEIPEEWGQVKLPALIIASASSEPHPIGYDICHVSLAALTTPEEIDAPAKVQARIGWLSAVFDEDRLDEIRDLLNPPVSGPDTRPVQGVQIIGIERDGEDHAENGRHVVSTLKLKVHAIGVG